MTPFAQRIQENRFAIRDRFLSAETCAELVERLKVSNWSPALAVPHGKYQGELMPDHRLSDTLSQFPAEVQGELMLLEMRIEQLLDTNGAQWEGWQAIRYPINGKFEPHNDTGLARHKDNERLYTVLITLQEPEKGGRTEFTQLGIGVPAVTGRALFWSNLTPAGGVASDMMHSGRPVESGEKWCLVNWIHLNSYRNG